MRVGCTVRNADQGNGRQRLSGDWTLEGTFEAQVDTAMVVPGIRFYQADWIPNQTNE